MPEDHPTPRPPRVLIVEDDPLQSRGLSRLLEAHDTWSIPAMNRGASRARDASRTAGCDLSRAGRPVSCVAGEPEQGPGQMAGGGTAGRLRAAQP